MINKPHQRYDQIVVFSSGEKGIETSKTQPLVTGSQKGGGAHHWLVQNDNVGFLEGLGDKQIDVDARVRAGVGHMSQ